MEIKQSDLRFTNVEDNFIWEGDDLHILLKDGTKWVFGNCWPQSVKFEGLDYENTEMEMVMLLNNYVPVI